MSSLFCSTKGGCVRTIPWSCRKFSLWKIMESPWQEGITRLLVDKVNYTLFSIKKSFHNAAFVKKVSQSFLFCFSFKLVFEDWLFIFSIKITKVKSYLCIIWNVKVNFTQNQQLMYCKIPDTASHKYDALMAFKLLQIIQPRFDFKQKNQDSSIFVLRSKGEFWINISLKLEANTVEMCQ